MIILHGIYDNGKIELTDKEKPQGRQEVQVILNTGSSNESHSSENLRSFFNQFQFDLSHFKFNREEANER
ncbi:MAG: hypothetical protein HPY53_07770 [Brevinematales bacterium]|nr:hypothetical protein [Brevinematales bacterium]